MSGKFPAPAPVHRPVDQSSQTAGPSTDILKTSPHIYLLHERTLQYWVLLLTSKEAPNPRIPQAEARTVDRHPQPHKLCAHTGWLVSALHSNTSDESLATAKTLSPRGSSKSSRNAGHRSLNSVLPLEGAKPNFEGGKQILEAYVHLFAPFYPYLGTTLPLALAIFCQSSIIPFIDCCHLYLCILPVLKTESVLSKWSPNVC